MLKFLTFLFSFCFLSAPLYSATVKKISKKGALYIDEGRATGFKKGAKACVYNNKDKKVACGKVVKALSKKAIIRISKKRLKKVKKGYYVQLQAEMSKDMEKAMQEKSEKAFKSPYSFAVGLNAHFLPLAPATYENLDFVAPGQANNSNWTSTSSSSSIVVPPGFGLEMEMLNLGLLIGLRYGVYVPTSNAAVYDITSLTNTLTTDTSASAIGFNIDYYFYEIWGVGLGFGLDYDITSIDLTGTLTDDADPSINEVLYTMTSSLHVLSLRFPIAYKYAFGSFGIQGRGTFILPVYENGPTQTISTLNETVQEEEDISTALGHTKNSFGFDLALGVFYRF